MMRSMIATICLLLLGSTLPVAAQEPAKEVKPTTTTIPFELLKTGHMAVQVKINGKGPYRLIFDTGAPMNLLNNKIAQETGLLKDKKKPLFALFGAMGEVEIDTLEVGGQEIKEVGAVVMDHPTVAAMARAVGPLYGIVGYPFFGRFRMTLDYQAKTMTLTPNGHKPANVMRSMQAALMSGLSGDQKPQVIGPASQWGISVNKKSDDDDPGVTVTKVLAGSAAADAGLKVGDRILTLDNRWTDSVHDAFRAVALIKPGETVDAKVKRDGKEMTLKVKPRAGF